MGADCPPNARSSLIASLSKFRFELLTATIAHSPYSLACRTKQNTRHADEL
jgi:hypothetical protein